MIDLGLMTGLGTRELELPDDVFGDLLGLAVPEKQEEQSATSKKDRPAIASADPLVVTAADVASTVGLADDDQVDIVNAKTIFDIETGPRPWDEIAEFYEPLPVVGEFCESSVKLGNLKDKVKIAEKIDNARKEHDAAIANYANAEAVNKAEFLAKAALSPITGRVLAIGYDLVGKYGQQVVGVGKDGDESPAVTEAVVLNDFWTEFLNHVSRNAKLIGFNIAHFDLPFLVRRSWALGVSVPDEVMSGRYWNRTFVDLMEVWQLGSREFVSLNTLAKFFGTQQKNGDGAAFAALYLCEETRKQAVDYLKNDLTMTVAVARKMGVI